MKNYETHSLPLYCILQFLGYLWQMFQTALILQVRNLEDLREETLKYYLNGSCVGFDFTPVYFCCHVLHKFHFMFQDRVWMRFVGQLEDL